MNLAAIHQTRGEHRRAIELNRRALSIAREREDRASIAMIQGNVGLAQWHLRAWDDALGAMSEALKLYEELGDRSGISRTLGNLGLLRESQGEHGEALELQA